MGATGSIGKQETAAAEQYVNLLNTVDSIVQCVPMNEPYIVIMQASSKLHNQWKQVSSCLLILQVKIEWNAPLCNFPIMLWWHQTSFHLEAYLYPDYNQNVKTWYLKGQTLNATQKEHKTHYPTYG